MRNHAYMPSRHPHATRQRTDASYGRQHPRATTRLQAASCREPATVSGLSLTLTNNPSSTNNATFTGVGSLNLTATLNVAANASGHAKLTFTPSLTSTSGTSATPEPATLGLFGLGLLGLGLVYRRKRALNS